MATATFLPTSGAASAGILATPALGTSATSPPTTRPRPRPSVHRSPAHGSPIPLVPTITRFIGVVPAAVRILIGALFALALVLAANSRLAARRALRLGRQRQQLLEDVGLLQAALLPKAPGRVGRVETSVAYRPADGPGAGGDFYDLFRLEDGQLAVIVGDLSGHGRRALPHTALVRFTLRAYLEAGLLPRDALQTAAAVLERQLGESFVTVAAATYNPHDRTLVYACAGHPPPVVLGSQSITPITVASSPPIGAGMQTGTRQTALSLPGQALVCFYTDGVTEARVGAELYGAARLARLLADLGPDATASALLDRVAEECDECPDDMASCLLGVEGAASAATRKVEELELDRLGAAGDRAERFLHACGVGGREIGEIVRSAHLAVERAGSVVLEVRFGDGAPEVELRMHNLAFLHTPTRQVASAS